MVQLLACEGRRAEWKNTREGLARGDRALRAVIQKSAPLQKESSRSVAAAAAAAGSFNYLPQDFPRERFHYAR